MIIEYNLHYKVDWGDTLDSIATKFDVDVHTLKYNNNVRDFYIGLVLVIPKDTEVDVNPVKRTLIYYLNRHANKKRYFKFYR